MMRRMLAFLSVLIAAPANAEVLSLICEHDSGISVRTGLPNHSHTEIFRIDFDIGKDKIITPFFADLGGSFEVTDYSVSWNFRFASANETYVYQLNRTTGTLFVTIITAEDRFVAIGKCTKPKRLF